MFIISFILAFTPMGFPYRDDTEAFPTVQRHFFTANIVKKCHGNILIEFIL